ncbi:hypothetical protein [Portibacter marinus]|uniref:hypothetical protein n=1 Tax=Portibacter marinus TaxID=2898660 RepID=UPI001F45D4F0|nr:hypothetical protein [Portibacter marinus]
MVDVVHFDIFHNTYAGEDALSMVTSQSVNADFGFQALQNLNFEERNMVIGNDSQVSNLSGINKRPLVYSPCMIVQW